MQKMSGLVGTGNRGTDNECHGTAGMSAVRVKGIWRTKKEKAQLERLRVELGVEHEIPDLGRDTKPKFVVLVVVFQMIPLQIHEVAG